jgi:hypothetical protein
MNEQEREGEKEKERTKRYRELFVVMNDCLMRRCFSLGFAHDSNFSFFCFDWSEFDLNISKDTKFYNNFFQRFHFLKKNKQQHKKNSKKERTLISGSTPRKTSNSAPGGVVPSSVLATWKLSLKTLIGPGIK